MVYNGLQILKTGYRWFVTDYRWFIADYISLLNSLKVINTQLQSDLNTLDTKLRNQNVDDMNGLQINNLSPQSSANI